MAEIKHRRTHDRRLLEEFCMFELENARKNCGKTQIKMAADLGVSQSYISRLEKGEYVPRDISAVIAIAAEYELDEKLKKIFFGLYPCTTDLETQTTRKLINELNDRFTKERKATAAGNDPSGIAPGDEIAMFCLGRIMEIEYRMRRRKSSPELASERLARLPKPIIFRILDGT